MKLYSFCDNSGKEIIALSFPENHDKLYSLGRLGFNFKDMNEFISAGAISRLKLLSPKAEALLDTSSLRPCAPIPHPKQDVICIGINYDDHAIESKKFHKDAFQVKKAHAVYFPKRAYKASGDGDVIPLYPGLAEQVDYECELAVVLGKDAFRVSEAEAKNYILGYTVLNDVSARNLQTKHTQWYFGKSLDGFTVFGPCILTSDEVPFPPALNLSCAVNGETRQNSNTKYLIHGVAELISELSQGMTLKAGTIISTGTPSGVGMGMDPPCFLKEGDTVACTIEKIGTIRNQCRN